VKLARMLKLIVWGLLGAAIAQELRRPADKRTWHGTVGGVVPYDFRVPSPEKFRRAWWDPKGPLITPTAFGVGWAINFARVQEMVNAKSS
jgi:uncharacterized protein DUF5808